MIIYKKQWSAWLEKWEVAYLEVDNINLEEIFEKYRDECESIFEWVKSSPKIIWTCFIHCFIISLCHSDITDLRPTSQLTKIIPEVTWEKFILDTYPNHKYQKNGKN